MATQTLAAPTRSLRLNLAGCDQAVRFHSVMGLILATLLLGEIAVAQKVHLNGMLHVLDLWPGMLFAIACWWGCRWKPFPRLIDSCELALWAVLVSNVLGILTQIAGRSSRPLVDLGLAMIDRRMHFQTDAIVHLCSRFPMLGVGFALAYGATPLLIFAAVLVPPLWGYRNESRRYILSVLFAGVLTNALFALWPAIGPWTTERFQSMAEQAAITANLLRLRASGVAVMDMQHGGIVSFPSFHVVLAILSAVTLSSVRWLRIPAWVLALSICVATITTGWHYLIDGVGGAGVAVVSIFAARLVVSGEREHGTLRYAQAVEDELLTVSQ